MLPELSRSSIRLGKILAGVALASGTLASSVTPAAAGSVASARLKPSVASEARRAACGALVQSI